MYEEEIINILFWRTINILSTASWQDRGAAHLTALQELLF